MNNQQQQPSVPSAAAARTASVFRTAYDTWSVLVRVAKEGNDVKEGHTLSYDPKGEYDTLSEALEASRLAGYEPQVRLA